MSKRKDRNTARFAVLRSRIGSLVLPADNPYDLELLLQAAAANARSYGIVALTVGRIDMRVTRREAERTQCTGCLRVAHPVHFLVDRSSLCERCASSFLSGRTISAAKRDRADNRRPPEPGGRVAPPDPEARPGRIDKLDGGGARKMVRIAGGRRRIGWRSLSGGALQAGQDGGEDVQPSRPQPRPKQIER